MTAKSLISPVSAKNLRSTIRENKKLMIVTSILHLLGIPMGSIVILVQLWLDSLPYDDPYYTRYVDLSGYMVIACCCLAAALLVGIIVAVNVFQELWKKTRVDMIYSLPMTGSQRFVSHYLAGAVIYVLPYLIACVLGWLILITGGFVLDWEAQDITRSIYFEILFKYYTIGTIGAFLLMMLYYTTTVLITVCCGTQFESIYTTLLLNCLVPGTIAAVLAVICDNLTGLSFEYLWQPIAYTSPAGGLIYLLYIMSGADRYGFSYYDLRASEATTHGMIPAFLRWSLVIVVVIAAVLVLAWHLYKKRRAEAVGQPFVYLLAYYIMLTLVTVLILTLMATGMEGAAILFAAIVFFIMEVVRKRGFKRFWMSLISFVCIVSVSLGLFLVVDATKAFGTVYRIPAASTVSSVRLSFPDMQGNSVELEYTDKEIIRAVQELHKDIVSDMKAYDDTVTPINEMMTEGDYQLLRYDCDDYGMNCYYTILDPETMSDEMKMYYYNYWYDDPSFEEADYHYAETEWVEITYYTVTGSAVHRSFDINIDQYMELLDTVYGTELYAKMYSDYFYDRLIIYLTEYDENGEAYLPRTGTLELYHSDASRTLKFLCSEELLARLRDAYYNDLLHMDPSDTGGVYALWQECIIWNSCTETIAVLEEMGMTPFSAPEKMGIADVENALTYYDMEYGAQTADILLFAPESIRFASESGRAIAGDAAYLAKDAEYYTDSFYVSPFTSLREVYPELYALMDTAVQYEFTENSYMLVVNGEWWAIPEEHTDLAEAVMAKGSGYGESLSTNDFVQEYMYQFNTDATAS